MNVTEAHRARHLLIHLDRGDDLPGALLSAPRRPGGARCVHHRRGHPRQRGDRRLRRRGTREIRRRIDTPSTVISLQGSAAMNAGALGARLTVTLARETDQGLVMAGGVLLAGLARSLDLWVTVLDDTRLERAPGEHGPALVARKHGSVLDAAPASPAPLPRPEPKSPAAPVIPPARGSEPQGAVPAFVAGAASAPPQKPLRPREDPARPTWRRAIGEATLRSASFTVVGSDGDNLLVRAEPDGRVRTLVLKVLRVEPQPDGPDGRRRFKLERKN
ncbi:MAG: hypothetical protein U0359_03420 [Byssovorax sp.]